MKLLRNVFIGVAALAISTCLSSMSFAEEGHHKWKENMEDETAKVKLMKDSAAALQVSNPTLAKGLSDWASEEEKEMQEWKEQKARHEAKSKLLTDSAAALEKTNPDLAKGLKKIAEKRSASKKHEMMEEKNEKEEAGETAEPKEEQNETKN
jgi:hypothetical protein